MLRIVSLSLLFLVLCVPTCAQGADAARVSHVVQISVDALGSKYLEKFLAEAPEEFPHFARFVKEGATTFNARSDYTHTDTLPNHVCMVTGRPVLTPKGWPECKAHYWTQNKEFPGVGVPLSLHLANPEGKRSYVASVFDVAHNAGLKTALYSGKDKFQMFVTSYDARYGGSHPRGNNKIDFALINYSIGRWGLPDLKKNAPHYAFLHFPEPDTAGHKSGYLGPEYRESVKEVDAHLGALFKIVETDPEWKGRTVLILSADHGGQPETKGHGDASHPYNYTIPFFVWGAGVKAGADLYALNADSRLDPGAGRPEYAPTGQPIRNGDGGNLALHLLGLPAIPNSFINARQDLKVN